MLGMFLLPIRVTRRSTGILRGESGRESGTCEGELKACGQPVA